MDLEGKVGEGRESANRESQSLPPNAEPELYRHVFAANVRNARRNKRMTQTALATLSGVNQGHLSSVERAEKNPTLDVMVKLANGLGLSLPHLLEPGFARRGSSRR